MRSNFPARCGYWGSIIWDRAARALPISSDSPKHTNGAEGNAGLLLRVSSFWSGGWGLGSVPRQKREFNGSDGRPRLEESLHRARNGSESREPPLETSRSVSHLMIIFRAAAVKVIATFAS
jgi:hypothetical protein